MPVLCMAWALRDRRVRWWDEDGFEAELQLAIKYIGDFSMSCRKIFANYNSVRNEMLRCVVKQQQRYYPKSFACLSALRQG